MTCLTVDLYYLAGMVIFQQRTCVIVTGANRGFGKSLCEALASEVVADSVFVLLGRSPDQLESTKRRVLELNPDVQCAVFAEADCSQLPLEELSNFFEHTASSSLSLGSCDLLLIHNAASVGDPSQHAKTLVHDEVAAYMQLNMAAMVSINNIVLEKFSACQKKTIVQISSLAAVQPVKSVAMYCAGM